MNDDANGESSFKDFLEQFEQATRGFINGDPVRWKQLASRRDDVTLMGGWGICEKGWTGVGARYDWAAARFRDSGAPLKWSTSPPLSSAIWRARGRHRAKRRASGWRDGGRADGVARDARLPARRGGMEAFPSPRGSDGQHDGAVGGPAAEMMR